LYDYFGFPRHTYHLTYPAANALDIVARAESLMAKAGIAAHRDPARGYDHGVFVPLKLMFPAADVPVVQLSLRGDLDLDAHLALGYALAPLRREGVLIIGSGYSFHNLHAMDDAHRAPSAAFDAALTAAACAPASERGEALLQWETFPHARLVHPREEHLLPLMVAVGAGDGDSGQHVFSEPVLGVMTSAYRFG
jgi:aromatic ring-opening dioxygenase catalytic subunit (LigB family)